jgi:uncharacterized protein YqjF (DUF2071 family)
MTAVVSPNAPFKQIFWQTWRDLVFVHWEVSPELIQTLLPKELEPDLFDGKAYVGLVPFLMTDIRLTWLPPIPGTSRTLETNVRTYVKRRNILSESTPAVWFFSLEAQSTLAVILARLRYGLPYFKANMHFEKKIASNDTITYRAESSRSWPQPAPATSLIEASFKKDLPFTPAIPGTIEHFLFERYALYTQSRSQIKYALVQHAPYRIKPGELHKVDSGLLKVAGLPEHSQLSPPLVHLAEDVVVKIGEPQLPF